MSDVTEVERLKSVIIEHVAKDVLILTENVDKLSEQLGQVGNMLKLLESNTENQFDLAAKQITAFLVEQEKHLAEIADSRTKQISMTVSDNVEKILNTKFENYQHAVDKALDKFESANVAAVDSLNASYKETEAKIKSGQFGKPEENKFGQLLTGATLLLSAVSVAGIISLVVALLI